MREEFDVMTQTGEAADYNTALDTADDSMNDPSLVLNAVDNVPKEIDDNLPRFAMSGLLPISLYRQMGNNSYGDFNKKDAAGRTIINYNYYPPFTIMPLLGGTFNIPYENQPSESDVPVQPEPFNFSAFISQPKNGYTSLKRSPKQCAETFMREARFSGGYVFNCLVGYHAHDDDKGLGAVRKLVDLLLPVRNPDIFPVTRRIKNGVAFTGPFLDELLSFVVKDSLQQLENAGLSDAEFQKGEELHREIRLLLQNGIKLANGFLNETESEIRNTHEIKKSYDPPNLEVSDAPVSTDLYCLAHTNRIEIDDKQLRASENIGKGMADPMTKAVDRLTDIAEMMANKPEGVPTKGVMTMDQVEELMRRQREEMSAEFDLKLKSLAVGQTVETPITEDVNDDEPQRRKPGRPFKT